MTILYSQIYDYLELPERSVSEDLRLNTKRLKRVIPQLAYSMEKFFSFLHPLSHSCVKGEVTITVKEFLKMLRVSGPISPHHEGLTEKIAGIRLFQKCESVGLKDWTEGWILICLEAGVNKSREAVQLWLGIKLMNLWWLLGSEDPVDMSIGFGRNTVIKKIAAGLSDRDSYEEEVDDLYT